jgi:hypothetical protein
MAVNQQNESKWPTVDCGKVASKRFAIKRRNECRRFNPTFSVVYLTQSEKLLGLLYTKCSLNAIKWQKISYWLWKKT